MSLLKYHTDSFILIPSLVIFVNIACSAPSALLCYINLALLTFILKQCITLHFKMLGDVLALFVLDFMILYT